MPAPPAPPAPAPRLLPTLDRYVAREWLKVFLITVLGFPLLVIVIDLTDNLGKYLSKGLTKHAVALSCLFGIPETVSLVLPAAVLFATVFTVGALGRHSELTAAKASGVSFHRLAAPIYLAGVAAFLLGLVVTELAPGASARKAELLGEKPIAATAQRYNFVYRADGGWVYAIRSLELRSREMRDVILEREGAEQRRAGGWTLTQGSLRYLLGPDREAAFAFDTLRTPALRERPVDLLAQPKAPDEMRYTELGRYIDALARSGSDTRKLRVEHALKLSIPFTCIIIALFGAPLAISTPKSGAAWGVAVCLATTFIDLLMFQLSKAVGAGGVLPPTFAAWFPNLVFGGAAVYLLKNTRT